MNLWPIAALVIALVTAGLVSDTAAQDRVRATHTIFVNLVEVRAERGGSI